MNCQVVRSNALLAMEVCSETVQIHERAVVMTPRIHALTKIVLQMNRRDEQAIMSFIEMWSQDVGNSCVKAAMAVSRNNHNFHMSSMTYITFLSLYLLCGVLMKEVAIGIGE